MKISELSESNYLGSVLPDSGKCDMEIWNPIEIAEGAFTKLSKLLKRGSVR